MTDQELHKVFEKRLPTMKSHINYNSEGKEDLIQEGMLGMWESLRKDPTCKDRFVKNGIRWGMVKFARKGKSVDSDIKSFNRRNLDIEIVKTDALEQEIADFILRDKTLPLDEKIIGKISWERFFKSLTWLERRFVKARLEELTTIEIYIKLKLGQYQYLRMRRSALAKFQEAFA
jgi:hypothetical protein